MDIDVEDALKFIMSLGVVTPGSKLPANDTSLSEVIKLKIEAAKNKQK